MNNAAVTDIKTERRVNEAAPSDGRIRPHITYLDFLKKNGLLQQAIEGTLPYDIEQAAKFVVATDLIDKHGKGKVRVVKDGNGGIAISVDVPAKDLEEAEVNDYIKHYRMENFVRAMKLADSVREFKPGDKYEIRSGFFQGRSVIVRGLDRMVFGAEWHANFGHPLCERHVQRVQLDGLPMRGRTYVVNLLDEKRDILVHESEIGAHIP